ncbi:MAG: glycosyltransferase [Pseudomonadota bacterium]|nr:glycosyltransferase [Pseudomonadota bacterium]
MNSLYNYAPVALFCYNRPDHLKRTVTALAHNLLASETDLYIFSDGPRSDIDAPYVQEIRQFIKTIRGFQSIQIKESPNNIGLARSIIGGVSEVLQKHQRIIVIEDDIVLSESALKYFNDALDFYQFSENIYSISGYNFPDFPRPKNYMFDTYIIPRMQCWGWSTWREKWAHADFDMEDFDKFINDQKAVAKYIKRIGVNSLNTLKSCVQDGKDVWACRWVYAHFRDNAYCVCPIESFVENIGLDGSGENCGNMNIENQARLNAAKSFNFVSDAKLNQEIFGEFMVRAVPGTRLSHHLDSRKVQHKDKQIKHLWHRFTRKMGSFIDNTKSKNV